MKLIGKKKKPENREQTYEERVNDKLREDGYTLNSSNEDLENTKALIQTVKDSQISYTDYLADKTNLNSFVDSNVMDKNTRMYHQYMMMQCIKPLQRGMNVANVMQTVGMISGIAMFNKDFRDYAGDVLSTKAYPYLRGFAHSNPDHIFSKALDKFNMMGREPMTVDSAACMHIGMLKRCYHDLREPGADYNYIMDNYNMALKHLYANAYDDGLNKDDIDRQMKTIVGRLLTDHPEQAVYFEELAYGDFTKAPSKRKLVYVDGSYKAFNVWQGDFIDTKGNVLDKSFNPRMPVKNTDKSLATQFRDTFYDYMVNYDGNVDNMIMDLDLNMTDLISKSPSEWNNNPTVLDSENPFYASIKMMVDDYGHKEAMNRVRDLMIDGLNEYGSKYEPDLSEKLYKYSQKKKEYEQKYSETSSDYEYYTDNFNKSDSDKNFNSATIVDDADYEVVDDDEFELY